MTFNIELYLTQYFHNNSITHNCDNKKYGVIQLSRVIV